MSLKSLGEATLGLLKKAIKQALHITSNGLIRIGEGDKEEVFVVPGGANPRSGWFFKQPDHTESNNIALIMALDGIL